MGIKVSIHDTSWDHELMVPRHVRNTPYIDWDFLNTNPNLGIYTDHHLHENHNEKIKVAYLVEPPAIKKSTYEYLIRNPTKFDYILTYDEQFYNNPVFSRKQMKYYYFGGCWIPEEQTKIYPKNKMVSLIASWKKITEGHKLRHAVVDAFGDSINVMGNGYHEIKSKVEGHADYMYSVVIENINTNFWWTEKLVDAYATGSVPIYWGCNINKFFNMDGIIAFKTLEELKHILYNVISPDDYQKRMLAIQDNLKRVEEYRWPEKSVLKALQEEHLL